METVYLYYCRVSSNEQAKDGFSIEAQKREIHEYATKNGIVFEDGYVDEGYTSHNLNRPGAKLLLSRISKNLSPNGYPLKKIILVIRTPNRLIRNYVLAQSLNKVFEKYHVDVKCLQGEWGKGSESDIASEIIMLLDENELKRIPPRVRNSLIETAKQGNYPYGHPPFGYDLIKNPSGKGSKIYINEEKADFVAWIFQQIAQGNFTCHELVNLIRIRKPFNKRWEKNTIHTMIRNPIYYGRLITKNGVDMENHSPAIVSKELWNEANLRLDKNSRENRFQYLFKGKCWCSIKDEDYYPMVGSSTIKTKKRNEKVYLYQYCPVLNLRVNESRIYEYFLDSYTSKLSNDFEISLIEFSKKSERLKYELNDIKENFEEGLITKEQFSIEKKEVLKKIKDLEKKISKLKKGNKQRNFFNSLSYSDKRKYIKRNIKKIEINFSGNNSYNIEIIFNQDVNL